MLSPLHPDIDKVHIIDHDQMNIDNYIDHDHPRATISGMGTIVQNVTETPTALAGIEAGRQYTVQNITANPVRLIVSDTAPDAGAEGFVLGKREFGYPKAGPGEAVFVWRDGRADSRVIYTLAS